MGLAVALPPGQSFERGERRMIELSFLALDDPVVSARQIRFADRPVPRELASVRAEPLEAEFADRPLLEVGTAPSERPAFHLEAGGHGPGREVRFRLSGETGARYRIEVSEDLALWESVRSGTLTGDTIEFVESVPGDARARFYRAVLLP